MAAPRGSFSRPFSFSEPTRTSKEPVLSVGGRAIARASAEGGGKITLTDEDGNNALFTVSDRSEVEITAWRPRRASPALYRVRTVKSGKEGWVSATNLERIAPPPPPKRPVAAAPPAAPVAKRAASPAPKRPSKPNKKTARTR